MALYQNNGTSYVAASRPYVKRNGVWVACEQAWVKAVRSLGAGLQRQHLPPDPPEITPRVVEDFNTVKGVKKLKTRWIKVGVRLPGCSNDPTPELIRVLTNYAGKPPTTQFGGTYTSTPDSTYPNEPWSEWRYNEYGGHNDTSVDHLQAVAAQRRGRHHHPRATRPTTSPAGPWTTRGTGVPARRPQIHVPKDSVDAAEHRHQGGPDPAEQLRQLARPPGSRAAT